MIFLRFHVVVFRNDKPQDIPLKITAISKILLDLGITLNGSNNFSFFIKRYKNITGLKTKEFLKKLDRSAFESSG